MLVLNEVCRIPQQVAQMAESLQRDKRRTYGFYSVLEAINVLFSYGVYD